MDDKTAIDVLKGLLKKYPLRKDEKEAVHTAIGILAWTKLVEGRVKSIKKRREARKSTDTI